MFEVEIKTQRVINDSQVYYEIIPVGVFADKLMYCNTYSVFFSVNDILSEAQLILNSKTNDVII